MASPYFLGNQLVPSTINREAKSSAQARGQALQQLLLTAAEQMVQQQRRWGEQWRDLLHESYFSTENLPVHQVIHKLHLAEATYHRHRNAAIHNLSATILRLAKPALRLEHVLQPELLVGRENTLTELFDALRTRKSVSISGPGGVGKTTLGRTLAHRVAPQSTFWYTFTLGLNDRSHSLLFALAWFLHEQGQSRSGGSKAIPQK